MSGIIKNAKELSTTTLRKDAVALIEATLAAIDTEAVLQSQLRVTEGVLYIQDKEFILAEYHNIFIVGLGKVSCQAALTLENIFAGQVKAGAVVGLSQVTCQVVDTYAGTHPLPSHQNYTATKHIEEIAHRAKEDDLVIAVVSGGGSALLCSSMGECEQGNALYTAYLGTGGTIEELNIVRKHISRLKGGGLAAALYPATVVGLIFSDVPGGDMAAVASGPTYRDHTTVEDARAIVDRYNLGTLVLNETPKEDYFFEKVHNFVMVSNEVALAALATKAAELGYAPVPLGSTRYTTPDETRGLFLEYQAPATCVFYGGETKLTIPEGCTGKGGRNDSLALSLLDMVSADRLFASIATDGHDNSDTAGALVDSVVVRAVAEEGLVISEYTECHNAYPFFQTTGGHITTGPLESNVADIVFWLNAAKDDVDPSLITEISGKVILDSRRQPTLTVTVRTATATGSFSVPSGASTGTREVVALPATEALEILQRTVAPALLGMSVLDQEAIDTALHELDGTKNFMKIGGNTALGVSVATLRAAAAVEGVEPFAYIAKIFNEPPQAEAPRLFVNMINGGEHAPFGSCIQEHQIIPETTDISVALTAVQSVWAELTKIVESSYAPSDRALGDEGGYALRVTDTATAYQHLVDAVAAANVGIPISLGTDIAASSFYDQEQNRYHHNGQRITPAAFHRWYGELHRQFPQLMYVEDPFTEAASKDFAVYQQAHKEVTTIGDDLTTTNVGVLERMIRERAVSGIIIKPNQIGTISDTLATMRLAYKHQIRCVVSHRSGETMDSFIADLAFGTKCFGLKAGAPTMAERGAKYRRLLSIAGYAVSPMQLVATIGPATASMEAMAAVITAGMDVMRLNLSWGTHEEHRQFIVDVREVAQSLGAQVIVIQDLSGPRVQKEDGHTFTADADVFTDKDRADIDALLDLQPEYIAQSFVASADDIAALRTYLEERGSNSKIIAKIERQEALDALDEIIEVADAVMVARGDLGDAVPFETLPFIKQEIITAARAAGKPVIVATEMLTSMQDDPHPSRADVSDIADAVQDGASATMLSNETAVGENPADAVRVMRTVIDEAYWRTKTPPTHWL